MNPIQLIFWANILCELLAPLLVISVLLIGNSRSIMGIHSVGWMTNGWLGLTVLVLLGGAVLFFYSLFTGGAGS